MSALVDVSAGSETAEFHGHTAVVTGAASGIGKAAALALVGQGAFVLALDIDPRVRDAEDPHWTGVICDVCDPSAVADALSGFAGEHAGIDHLVSNAGIFTSGAPIAELGLDVWDRSIRINLTSHLIVMKEFLRHRSTRTDRSIVVVGSRNVMAPGPGAAAYSVAKAGLSQLARVAALELASVGIRVNVVHPDAVFDTALWTPEALRRSAERYHMTVEEYKHSNLLGQQVRLQDVSNAICALLGSTFARTTGAQIPVDGGNIRVI